MLLWMSVPCEQAPFFAIPFPPNGIYCSPYNDLTRLALRRVQDVVLRQGLEETFNMWDGIDDSVPDSLLSWKELRQGLSELVMYDNWGSLVSLTGEEIEMLLREFNDDDSEAFRNSQWGSSFYVTDGSDSAVLDTHNEGRPRNQLDGNVDNALCNDVNGNSFGICNQITPTMFSDTVRQIADSKYSQNCNGHGICDQSVGFCVCDRGWSGMNCSQPEVPCDGVIYLQDPFGSFSAGYGRDRIYGFDKNCTWVIAPPAVQTHGLPTVLVIKYFITEIAFDVLSVYEGDFIHPNNLVASFDGLYPGGQDAIPQMVVVPSDRGATINFVSDGTNSERGLPSDVAGFEIMYGMPLDFNYVLSVRNPLIAAPCNRQFKATEQDRCVDAACNNCGISLDEQADQVINSNTGDFDNMCYIGNRPVNEVTHENDPINGEELQGGYKRCSEVADAMLTHKVGDTVTAEVQCPRASAAFAVNPLQEMDKPEYILGPGPPQFPPPGRFEQGQAHQLGFVFGGAQWFQDCDDSCTQQRLSDNNNLFFQDEVGRPGPVLGAIVSARTTSVASNIQAPWITFPPNQFTGELFGYEQSILDPRTREQANSGGIRDAFGATFTRCKDNTVPKCDLGTEKCSVSFTPTIPGVYDIEFYNLRKWKNVDDHIHQVPFPAGQFHRTIVVQPGPTSAGHSHAYGPGLAFAFASRSGLGSYFWIDAYDRYGNPRLTGGDQWNVAMVAPDKGSVKFGRVTNMGNGTYFVGYNITVSGRYTVSITLKDTPDIVECFAPDGGTQATTVPLLGGATLSDGERRCHAGRMLANEQNRTLGVTWCSQEWVTERGCNVWTFQNPTGLAPQAPQSPYSIWIDSGPTGTDTIQAFGWGMSTAIAGYPAFFTLRIRDVYGNWASQKENVSITFTVPEVAQQLTNSTTPISADAEFAGDEFWQGDYSVNWNPVIAGWHRIAVRICNPACTHIRGSPFAVDVEPSPTYGPNSTVEGSGIVDGIAGEARVFVIQDKDSAGNNRTLGGENFEMKLTGLSMADCPFIQEKVLVDVTCRCSEIFSLDMKPCRMRPLQLQPGPVISPNVPPELSCLYMRNQYSCVTDCCPNVTMLDGCSNFNYPPENGAAAYVEGCGEYQCSSPISCRSHVRSIQSMPQTGNMFQVFLNTAMRECPQLERIGLESSQGFTGSDTPWVLPPDPTNDKTFGLIALNLDPTREVWRGAMTLPEVLAWISVRDINYLYYTRASDTLGPYFTSYGNATGDKAFIEGFVDEYFSTLGQRSSATSRGSTMAPLNPNMSTAVGHFAVKDHDDGRYTVTYNVTRAGLYSLAVSHGGLGLHKSPYNFLIKPDVFDPSTCVITGTGASKDKNLLSGTSGYKSAVIAGKFVNFDLRLRDKYWNYLWVSRPENEFSIFFEPMQVRYFDTALRAESVYSWPAEFRNYTLHDNGDANYRIDYIITTAGNFPLKVRLRDPSGASKDLDKSPYMITVRPDKVHVPSSTAYGKGLQTCGAGLVCSFAIETRDLYGNRRVLPPDEGPYCHTWNPNVNNGGSGGNAFTPVFPDEGCTPGESCTTVFTRWSQTQPASGPVVQGPPDVLPFPALSNEVAYLARGGVLHDCVPLAPFADPATYNEKPSCNSTRLGPCGIYDLHGRTEQPIWEVNGAMYTWFAWRATFPALRGKYVGIIPGAEPQRYQQFDIFIDEENNYGGSYNITKAGTYQFALTYMNDTDNTIQHICGSPFSLTITGGLTTPETCIGRGQGMFSAQVGYPATFTVVARDRFGNERTLGRERVEVFIQGNNLVQPIPVKTLDRLDGTYHVEYNATVPGTYSMSISILEHDIPGSPFRITVQKGFHLPYFNTSWGLNFAGDAALVALQGGLGCYSGATGCVNAVRLTRSEKNSTGAVWFNTMQRVELGFEATFSFQINELSRHCKTKVIIDNRCMERGGDGLAFVIHENGFSHALGSDGASMGYGGIDNSVAVEFDTWYNADLGDVYQNHVAVHTLGRQPNTPSMRSRLCQTTNVPNLADGNRHTARVRYEHWTGIEAVTDESWYASPYSLDWLQFGSGVLKIFLDDLDRPVLTCPISINNTLALAPGGQAWVGVTAATGVAQQAQHVYSLSFRDGLCRDDCNYKGECVDGECICDTGFYGRDCQFVQMRSDHVNRNLCPMSDAGQQESFPGLEECACPPGFSGPLGGPCFSCPPDSFKPDPGPQDCFPCPANAGTLGRAGIAAPRECVCLAGYVGDDGGPCFPVREDTFKTTPGAYPNAEEACPANSGTLFRRARSSKLDCLCRPGHGGPNGGPCNVCPSNTWKPGWGSAACDNVCPTNSHTMGCAGAGGNTACISGWQCVCDDGWNGKACHPGSPQAAANHTCPPCVITAQGPTLMTTEHVSYDHRSEYEVVDMWADHREGKF